MPPTVPGGREQAITADQTNQSVVVDDLAVVKWVRQPTRDPHPAPALLAHLGEVGYRGVPSPLGVLTWTASDGSDIVLAFIDAFLPAASDGWDWCVQVLVDHLDHAQGACPPACEADFPEQLGELVGGLHVALSSPSSVFPVPIGRVEADALNDWRRRADLLLEEAIALTDGPDGQELALIAPRIAETLGALSGLTHTAVMRVHGDLHVGQVLRWRGGLAVIDFDGNPTLHPSHATDPQPAARDVAQMVRSLDHVGRVANRRTDSAASAAVQAWVDRSRHLFLTAYRRELARADRTRLFDERLLAPFEVEQECRELIYAAHFLPRWRYAPMAALRALFPDGAVLN